MDTGFALWLLAVSVGASALGGMLGMASGIFIVPILTIFGHINIHTAIGASLVSVIACSCGSAAPFLKGRLTNIRLAIVLETATTLGALTGVLLAGCSRAVSFFPVSGDPLLSRAADDEAPARRPRGPVRRGCLPGNWSATLQLDAEYHDAQRAAM